MGLVSFNTLPMELLQLIVVELSDQDIRALSVTCRIVRSLLHNLYTAPYFWRARYARVAQPDCAIETLLPEVITHYGWKKLYYRCTNHIVPIDKLYYVGPTGNFYAKAGSHWCLLLTLPVKEVLFLNVKGDYLILLYVNFSSKVIYHVVEHIAYPGLTNDGAGINIYHDFDYKTAELFADVVRYHADDKFVVILLKDGTVIINNDPKKLCNLFFLFEKDSVIMDDVGLMRYVPPMTIYSINKGVAINVSTVDVSYQRNINLRGRGTIVFRWSRHQG